MAFHPSMCPGITWVSCYGADPALVGLVWDPRFQHFSGFDPTQELVGNAESQALPQTSESEFVLWQFQYISV